MKFLKDVTFFIRNGASIKQRKGCSGIPITRIETLSNGRFNYDHLGYADIFDSDTYKKYYLKDNDVLFSHINSEKFLGRTVLYHPKNKTENIIHGMNLLCLRFNQSEYSPEFFYWYSKSSTAKEFYRINTKHAVNQASIPSSAIKEMPIPDFTLNKQYTIVHSLNQIQSSIDYKLDQITKLDSLVKSRFMEMFGEWNLSFQKENWIKLSDLTNIYTGTTPKTEIEEYWNGLIPWVTPAELDKDSYLITDTERHITEKGQKSKSLTMMPIGTVLLSTRAPIGKVAICGVPMTCNQGFKNFECLEKLHPTYLFYLLKLNNDWLQTQGTGTTFKEISKSKAGNIRIPVPTMSDQKDFAQFYNLVDKSRFVVQKEIKDLQELLDSKMDEYFGGEE